MNSHVQFCSAWMAVLCSLTVIGCTDSRDDLSPLGDPEKSSVGPLERYCQQLATKARALDACYPDFNVSGVVDNTEGSWCPYADAVEQGRLRFHETAAARCLDAVNDLDTKNCAYTTGEASVRFMTVVGTMYAAVFGDKYGSLASSLDCSEVFTASVDLGEVCREQRECTEGYCKTDQCPSVCTPHTTIGESCFFWNECGPLASCSFQTSECISRDAEGEPCRSYCLEGLVCNGTSENLVCSQPPTLGEACYLHCDEGLLCVDGVCALESDFYEADLGETCFVYITACPPESVCYANVCSAFGQQDEPCPCATGFFCSEGSTCHANGDALGEPCSKYDEDSCTHPNLWCQPNQSSGWDGTCQARGMDVGEACVWNERASCANGLWCDRVSNTCQQPVGLGSQCNPRFEWGDSSPCTEGVCYNEGEVTATPQPHETCRSITVRGVGESCGAVDQTCDDGLYCSYPQRICAEICDISTQSSG